jgi:hypothetical protein
MFDRYNAVQDFIAKHQDEYDQMLYSPIVHYHHMAVAHKMPTNWEWWWKLNKEMLDHCTTILELRIDGWETSKGMQAEIKYAEETEMEHIIVIPSQI